VRTAAATQANRRRELERLAFDLACGLDRLADDRVAALAGVLLAECRARGLEGVDVDSLEVK
jgi:hypothetical protein